VLHGIEVLSLIKAVMYTDLNILSGLKMWNS